MKNNIIYLIFGAFLVWCLILSLPKENKSDETNYELLQEVYKYVKRRDQVHELQIKQLQDEIKKDSVFVYSATRDERDSLRAKYNPF